jgi:hypothetical protein
MTGETATFTDRSEARVSETPNRFGELRRVHHFYEDTPGPEGFQVWMPPSSTANAHFHRIDQFQLFFGAAGAQFLRTPIEKGTMLIHYTDAYSTYGPFIAGDEPLEFFTLRAIHDEFIGYMPQDRALRTHRGGRHFQEEVAITGGLDEPGRVEISEIVERQDDNLVAYDVRSGPGADIDLPTSAGSNGQYCYIVAGDMCVGDRQHVAGTLGWIPPTSTAVSVTSREGCQALLMQFPPPTVAPVSAPER